ncbi:hypothetical protein Sme01_72740 [Sphaerisporangium melleum]|uniref:Uncharacterized protein n=1 Tax=Sphaerisporangium melleum TaxID=321316 RepID=A0A917VVJ2_9ACTN|nr:hypothetical protein GCM10007964_70720 [Sphaerisporangium melleum]GII74798.1 hypothetical protein Sme01_72740 [Sphaerisporangium melleum]
MVPDARAAGVVRADAASVAAAVTASEAANRRDGLITRFPQGVKVRRIGPAGGHCHGSAPKAAVPAMFPTRDQTVNGPIAHLWPPRKPRAARERGPPVALGVRIARRLPSGAGPGLRAATGAR